MVAFGQQKKSSFTGSAGVVKADVLNKKQLTNVLSGLKGEVAGVQMTNTSGSPTSTPSFAIRGFGSINANSQPLIIVDVLPTTVAGTTSTRTMWKASPCSRTLPLTPCTVPVVPMV